MNARDIWINIAAFPPYAVGWVAGTIVRFCRWVRRAVQVGYLDGIGDEEWQERQHRYELRGRFPPRVR